MALSIGTIKQISGIVMARNASGEDRVLKVGDMLNAEDVISTIGAGSHVVLTLNDGREIVLNGNDNVTLDQSVYMHAQNFADESVVQGKTIEAVSSNQSVEDIQAALLRGEDISALEATEKLEQLRVLDAGYKIKTIQTDYQTIGVDTPEDLRRVELLLREKENG